MIFMSYYLCFYCITYLLYLMNTFMNLFNAIVFGLRDDLLYILD